MGNRDGLLVWQDRGYLVSDNLIHDMPVEYSGANPVFIGYTADARLSYNTIEHSR